MSETIWPVILSGGAGTRLWPLSLPARPKQLLALTGERTMLQETFATVTRDAVIWRNLPPAFVYHCQSR